MRTAVTARLLAAAALAAGVTLVATPSPATAYPASCSETFPAGPVPQAWSVPPQATSTFDIPVATAGQVGDLDIDLWAYGVQAGDFSVGPADDFVAHHSELASVGGTVDLEDVTFDDEAAGELSGTSPFTGRFRPVTPLSALDGLATARSWELRIVNAGNATFTGYWSLTVTYAGCEPDTDGDGVADSVDRCVSTPADTTSGCPPATRDLTSTYRRGAFRGTLSSDTHACRASREVTVWKVRRGADLRIGTDTTSAKGAYALTRDKKRGTYYATSRRVVVTDVAECPAVTSDRFRIG